MNSIPLRQTYYGGITIQVPEIWNVETEVMEENDGQKVYSIGISASGQDVRSIDISYGPMPEGSDAYAEACGTYEEVTSEEDLNANDEPILCFDFKGREAYGFSLTTDEGLPCFFFCQDITADSTTNLLTVLLCAAGNEDLQSLVDFVEEYLSVR